MIEHRASFTFLERTDQLVVVQNFVYCQVVKIDKNSRVRDMVFIKRPSDTHEYSWLLLVPKTSIENSLGKVVVLSRVPDAGLGLPTVGLIQAPTQFQREQWPAFPIKNRWANTGACNKRLNSRTRPSSNPWLDKHGPSYRRSTRCCGSQSYDSIIIITSGMRMLNEWTQASIR